MNISAYILEYLKENGVAEIPGFGVFFFKNSKAVINPEDQSILPPANEIAFSSDYKMVSAEFPKYLSSQKTISLEAASEELKIQTDYWKKKLQSEQMLEISSLGNIFIEDHQIHFRGNRVEVDSPDFYGLETIKFSEIKNKNKDISTDKSAKKEYKISKSPIFWLVLLLAIAGLAWGAYTNQEALFGKKSFDINELMNRKEDKSEVTKPIENPSLKIDSLNINADSIKKDSLQKNQVIQHP